MPVTVQANADGSATLKVNGSDVMTASSAGINAPGVAIGGVAAERLQQLTSVSTTSGTFVDFTIPAWAKKVTLTLAGVSTSGASVVNMRLAAGGTLQTSGYQGSYMGLSASNTTNGGVYGSDFAVSNATSAADIRHGTVTLTNHSGNTWVISGVTGISNSAWGYLCAGSTTLSGVLDRIRIGTANGTDTFDAGSISVIIEG